ncbi:hypothetical protein EV426DRAFT_250565 [Tirmania nivea]|nr:hypothetical protein EV426DRAFT_250565 [Tirmania nivea]
MGWRFVVGLRDHSVVFDGGRDLRTNHIRCLFGIMVLQFIPLHGQIICLAKFIYVFLFPRLSLPMSIRMGETCKMAHCSWNLPTGCVYAVVARFFSAFTETYLLPTSHSHNIRSYEGCIQPGYDVLIRVEYMAYRQVEPTDLLCSLHSRRTGIREHRFDHYLFIDFSSSHVMRLLRLLSIRVESFPSFYYAKSTESRPHCSGASCEWVVNI